MTNESRLGGRHAVALASHQSGDLLRAEALYLEILEMEPQHAEAIHGLGVIAYQRGSHDVAIDHLRRALDLSPNYEEARCNLGAVLIAQNRPLEALRCYNQDNINVTSRLETHRAHALAALGRLAEAAQGYRKALVHDPFLSVAYAGLGKALSQMGCGEEAVAALREALRLAPESAEAHFNLATGLKRLGHLREALVHFDESVDRWPDNPLARVNRSTTLLLTGDYSRGWLEYEWRWRLPGMAQPSLPGPVWDGKPIPGGTVLLHAEQGVGDTLQFVRYAALVRRLVGRVVLLVPGRLIPLLSSYTGIDAFADEQALLPACDAHAHLMSLPTVLRMTSADVPADVPYLSADQGLVESWKQRMADVIGLRVGVCWQGNPLHPEDTFRSFPLAQLETLARIPGVRLVSLQRGPGVEQMADVPFPIVDLGDGLDQQAGSFMDTAAVIMNLDLVVTADTAVAHLAGALGAPVWIALAHVPDWRWLMGRPDSPWYPTARLFRQPIAGDWSSVFAEMALALPPTCTNCGAISIEVTPGELFDRIATLQIKAERVTDPLQLAHVRAELAALETVRDRRLPEWRREQTRAMALRCLNATLWEVEDALRACERDGDFSSRFVELARSVSRNNDARDVLKRELSERFGGTLLEQKNDVK